jgi:hypothetical protein
MNLARVVWTPSWAALRQWAIALAALGLCPVAAVLIGDDPTGPVERARALMDAERAVGVNLEPAVHGWTLGHPWLMDAAAVFYIVAHIGVAGWTLVWTWCIRRDRFRSVRDAFLWTQALLVVVYVAVPTAPPRLVPGEGFTDTLSGLWGRQAADSAHLLQSPFAAVPSGHVAFALLAGITFARFGDVAWLRGVGWVYPPLMIAVTVATGNHLLVDAAASVLVVVVALVLAVGRRWRRPTPAMRQRRRRVRPNCARGRTPTRVRLDPRARPSSRRTSPQARV